MTELRIAPLAGLPEIAAGDDLAASIIRAGGDALRPGTIVCIAHKLVSKAEDRIVTLGAVVPGEHARRLAERHGKDPRHLQVILDETAEVVAERPGVLICRTHHGFTCANAGVDRSNAPGDETVVLLPQDPDASARRLRAALQRGSGVAPVGVLISDSFGRPWRVGQLDVAIGLAGLAATDPHEGRADRAGRPLRATEPAVADAVAAAAELGRTKAGGEGVVLVHGLERFVTAADGPGAVALLRAAADDLFRTP